MHVMEEISMEKVTLDYCRSLPKAVSLVYSHLILDLFLHNSAWLRFMLVLSRASSIIANYFLL